METTLLISKIIGPVLLLRGISILVDRRHFEAMLDGLEKEVTTVAFSMFPIALLMSCIALALLHRDYLSPAGIVIQIIAWGGVLKGSILILCPNVVVAKAVAFGKSGFLNVVCVVCIGVGAYLIWFGYLQF